MAGVGRLERLMNQFDSALGHLCRQVGSVQAHMGFGGSVALRPDKETAQLSINLRQT
jgi:hypothetical protein